MFHNCFKITGSSKIEFETSNVIVKFSLALAQLNCFYATPKAIFVAISQVLQNVGTSRSLTQNSFLVQIATVVSIEYLESSGSFRSIKQCFSKFRWQQRLESHVLFWRTIIPPYRRKEMSVLRQRRRKQQKALIIGANLKKTFTAIYFYYCQKYFLHYKRYWVTTVSLKVLSF